MLSYIVSMTTPDDTSESRTEGIGGSPTEWTVAPPELGMFDELSSSSSVSGPGFVSAEHFISALLRDEETSSVASNDANSTYGDSWEMTMSSESENNLTMDGFAGDQVSTSSGDSYINTPATSHSRLVLSSLQHTVFLAFCDIIYLVSAGSVLS